MSRKTLLVACGGSGIKTLMRFNEMLSGNTEWKKRLPDDVAYLIIDTEVELTKSFEETVSAQLGGAKGSSMPLIRLVQITKGLHALDEVVEPSFCDKEGDKGFDRLRPHWWFSPDGKTPFNAQYVHEIEQGAGQCAPVSYLCTWKSLPQFEKIIDDLLKNLARRNMDSDAPLENMQVFFVSGLAGGTGRGSWTLAAFKVRKYLEERGFNVNPTGVFFERGCYPNVGKNDADMDTGMKVNTITGLSELSAWMRIHEGHEKYCYNLPNLQQPDESGETDVIRNSDKGLNAFKRSPLNSAYLICSNNGYGGLDTNSQYHEMAAAALYTLVAGSQFVGPTAINRLKNFGSLAACTFEVNTVRLRSYFEAYLRKAAVEAVRVKATKGSTLDQEADQIIAGLADEEHELHGLASFAVPAAVGVNDISAANPAAGNVVQKAIAILRSNNSNVQAAFAVPLQKQKPKDAWAFVTKSLALGDISKARAAEAVEQALVEAKVPDLNAALRDLVKMAYAPKGKAASLGRAIAVAEKLKKAYADALVNLDARVIFGKDAFSDEKDLLTRFKPDFDEKAERNTLKEKLTFTNFTPEEIKYLTGKFSWLYNCAIFFKIRPALKKKFEDAQALIDTILKSCTQLSQSLSKVQTVFSQQAERNAGAKKGVSAYRALFTAKDTASMLADIPIRNDVNNVYRRTLKPIKSQEEIGELLLAPGSSSRRDATINSQMTAEFVKLMDFDGAPDSDYIDALESSLEQLFTSNVFLAKDFMDKNFSFVDVLKGNIDEWNCLISDVYGNMDAFQNLRQRFIDFLGVDLDDEDEEDVVRDMIPSIKWKGLIRKIVISLIGASKPWVELDSSVSKKYLETLALLPLTLDRNQASDMKNAVLEAHESQNPTIIHLGSDSEGGYRLPMDRIVVFASQCIAGNDEKQALDLIKSINYYTEPRVKAALELAECADSRAYFQENKGKTGFVERERGLGYVSPVFVNDPKLSLMRWRPWCPAETVDQVEARMVSIDAVLLYAFLGVDAKAAENAILDDIEERFGWKLPLLEMGKGKSEDFTFSREPLVWEKGRGEEDGTPAWQAGEVAINSIDNLYAYLKGDGKPGLEGSKLIKSQQAGKAQLAHLISEAEAFAKNIVPEIGATALGKLSLARNKWLTARERAATKDDKPFWQRLQLAAKGQKS